MKKVFFTIVLIISSVVNGFSAILKPDSANNQDFQDSAYFINHDDMFLSGSHNTFKIINRSGDALLLTLKISKTNRYKRIFLDSSDSVEMSISSLLPCMFSRSIIGFIVFNDSSKYSINAVKFYKIPVGTWIITSDDIWSAYVKEKTVIKNDLAVENRRMEEASEPDSHETVKEKNKE